MILYFLSAAGSTLSQGSSHDTRKDLKISTLFGFSLPPPLARDSALDSARGSARGSKREEEDGVSARYEIWLGVSRSLELVVGVFSEYS